MPALNRRLDLLRRLPRSLREAALLATLAHADGHERDAVVAEILALSEGSSERAVPARLLHSWGSLSAEARGAVLSTLGARLPSVLAGLRRSSDGADRGAAVHLAIGALMAGGGEQLGASLAYDGTTARLGPEIDEALALAAARYDEERAPAVMDAVARVAHAPGARLREWLDDTAQPGHMALRGAARALPAALRRRRAVAWLAVPALRGLARDELTKAETAEDWRQFWREAHLLRPARRGPGLRSCAEAATRMLEASRGAEGLTGREARGVIRWTRALPLKPGVRARALAGAFASGSALVRFDAASALATAAPSPETDAALVDFAFDECEPVAHLAASALADAESPSRRAAAEPTLRRLVRSPHERVRALAREGAESRDPLVDPAAARRALSAEPLEFLIALRRAYAGAAGDERVRLLGLAARVGALDRVEEELLTALEGGDERLASKAALLAGRAGGSERLRSALERALVAPAARVRANAVEAFLRAAPEDRRQAEWLGDERARVRANAVRHRLIVRRDGAGERLLAEMLGDGRPEHRLSALWVAERARSVAVVNRVADLTRHDDDPLVHARARRCARALLATMRHGWSTSKGAA